MGTSGSGGTDVQRLLAYRGPAPAQAEEAHPCHCHCHAHAHEDVGAMLAAAPFGFDVEWHDVCVDALVQRQGHVKKLVKHAKELLTVAHEALLAGSASAADRRAGHVVEDWLDRLLSEEDHLGIEIRRFGEGDRAKHP